MAEWHDQQITSEDIPAGTIEGSDLEPGLQEVIVSSLVQTAIDAESIDGARIDAASIVRAKLAADVTGMETYWEMKEDFNLDDGATLPLPWLTNREAANEVQDFMADEPNGVYRLGMTTDSEAQAVQIQWGDHLLIDADADPIIEFRIRVDNIAGMTSLEQAFWGVCPAHTNAETASDNIDDSCWFIIMDGNTDILVETDDGSVDNDDKDSGLTLVDDAWTVFTIDMSNLADIKMYVDGVEQAYGTLVMSASAGTVLQPIVCMQRSGAGETEPAVEVEVDYIHVYQKRTA